MVNTGLFDMAEASASSAWTLELEKEEHLPETEEYGISSTAFVNKEMPFHPERLHDVLTGFGAYKPIATAKGFSDLISATTDAHKNAFQGVVRTKGQLWLANANALPVYFQTAGNQINIRPSETPFLLTPKKQIGGEWNMQRGNK